MKTLAGILFVLLVITHPASLTVLANPHLAAPLGFAALGALVSRSLRRT